MAGKWTPEDDVRLMCLFDQELSCRQIALQLDNGFSRNAVIGRIHRLGLKRKTGIAGSVARLPKAPTLSDLAAPPPIPKPAHVNNFAERNANARAKRALVQPGLKPVVSQAVQEGRGVKLVDLAAGCCRWPLGDPFDDAFRYCGHVQDPGSPYCPYHHALSVEPRRPPRNRLWKEQPRRLANA